MLLITCKWIILNHKKLPQKVNFLRFYPNAFYFTLDLGNYPRIRNIDYNEYSE